ncbi:MAG: hypothetical protein ABRQ37_27640, partial [Candidatus Eremiobacterota bacterium]
MKNILYKQYCLFFILIIITILPGCKGTENPATPTPASGTVSSATAQTEDKPVLVESSYNGFNIVTYKNKYYGLSMSLGSIDLTTTDEKTISEYEKQYKCVVTSSPEETKHMIDKITNPLEAKLVEEKFHGFNIVSYKNMYYGIALSIGQVDIPKLDKKTSEDYRKQKKCFIADTTDKVKHLILTNTVSSAEPVLIETYNGFNIV